MKIAVFGILAQQIFTDALGGTEVFTANLVNGLAKNGHDVTLFATSDSQVDAKVDGLFDSNFYCNPPQSALYIRRPMLMHMVQFSDFLEIQDSFDFVHISVAEWWLFLPFLKLLKIPHCITLHNRELPKEDIEFLFNKYPEANFVFAQNSQINSFPELKKCFVVLHGIDINKYKFQEESDNYLTWVGRLVAGKGLEHFATIQTETENEIKFGGSGEASDFFQQFLESNKNNPMIKYVGPQDINGKNALLGRAKLFIFPRSIRPIGGIMGLTIAEANACGTPVLTYDAEASRETIQDGVNGFLVENGNLKEFSQKIKELDNLSNEDWREIRGKTRKFAELNFLLEKMIKSYEEVYLKIKETFHAKN